MIIMKTKKQPKIINIIRYFSNNCDYVYYILDNGKVFEFFDDQEMFICGASLLDYDKLEKRMKSVNNIIKKNEN